MEAESQPFNNICKANGCPLTAAVVTHWYERQSKRVSRRPRWGVCRFHRAAEASDWSHVTRLINDHSESLKLFAGIEGLTHPSLKPITGESVAAWLARVNEYHKSVILPAGTQPDIAVSEGLHQLQQLLVSNIVTDKP